MDLFNRKGEKITLEEFMVLFKDRSYQVLKQDDVGPYLVSTIWLGIDHSFGRPGPPVIFETMVFDQAISVGKYEDFEYRYRRDHEQQRWATEQQALEGHERICEEVRLSWETLRDSDPREVGG